MSGQSVPPGMFGKPDYIAPHDQEGESEVSPPFGEVIGQPPPSTRGRIDQNQLGSGIGGAVLKGRRPGQ